MFGVVSVVSWIVVVWLRQHVLKSSHLFFLPWPGDRGEGGVWDVREWGLVDEL